MQYNNHKKIMGAFEAPIFLSTIFLLIIFSIKLLYMKTLYLGSQSRSRQDLLREAGISFEIIESLADESSCDWGLPLQQLVTSIAVHKMDHIIIPPGTQEGKICYVLTGDTLGVNADGLVCGKPHDREDAIAKLKSYRRGAQTGSAFCLDQYVWRLGQSGLNDSGSWERVNRHIGYASATYIFDVPDDYIDFYFDTLPLINGLSYRDISGAVAIEKLGAQFVQSIQGSYTAICGLPMAELRKALTEMGFFNE
jgi:septum formation protein